MKTEDMIYRMSRVLVALDFSDFSMNALSTAVSLADKWNAKLYLIHVAEDIVPGDNRENISDHFSDVLHALAADVYSKTGTRAEVFEKKGNVTEHILKVCSECDITLVVMGSNGASGEREGFVGSNTYTVVKFAPCPVLIVTGTDRSEDFKRPLLPVRPVASALRHYQILRHFLAPNSMLNILGLSPAGKEGKVEDLDNLVSDIRQRLADDNVSFITQWNDQDSIPDNVLKYSEKNNSDLIIITPAIDVTSKRYFVGPFAQKIIHNSRVPLLYFNRINLLTPASQRTA